MSNVIVSMKMSPRQAGKIYMQLQNALEENTELKKANSDMEYLIRLAIDDITTGSKDIGGSIVNRMEKLINYYRVAGDSE